MNNYSQIVEEILKKGDNYVQNEKRLNTDSRYYTLLAFAARYNVFKTKSGEEYFNDSQMAEIRIGLEKGLDISQYSKPEFNSDQMKETRIGLEKRLDISWYAKPEFNFDQMKEIRIGLEKRLDISLYAKPEIPYFTMRGIRYMLMICL